MFAAAPAWLVKEIRDNLFKSIVTAVFMKGRESNETKV